MTTKEEKGRWLISEQMLKSTTRGLSIDLKLLPDPFFIQEGGYRENYWLYGDICGLLVAKSGVTLKQLQEFCEQG
jgi:hypothetical protein